MVKYSPPSEGTPKRGGPYLTVYSEYLECTLQHIPGLKVILKSLISVFHI